MFELSPEQIEEMTKQAITELKASLREDIKNQLTRNLSYTVAPEVNKIVAEFFKAEILPELQRALIEQKPFIIEAALVSASQLATILATEMVKTVSEKMGQTYGRQKVFEVLFGR